MFFSFSTQNMATDCNDDSEDTTGDDNAYEDDITAIEFCTLRSASTKI